MFDVHIYAALPEEDRKPANKANAAFTRMVHAFDRRPVLPQLKRDEERELIGMVQDSGCQASMSRLVEAHMGFVVNIANNFCTKSGMQDQLDDFYSEGCEGFMKAVKKYNLKRQSARLSTLARYYVTASCLELAKSMKHAFRVATNVPDKAAYFGLNKIRKEFFELHGRGLRYTEDDIEAASVMTGIPTRSIKRALDLERSGPAVDPESLQIHDMRVQDRPEVQMSAKSDSACLERHIEHVSDSLIARDRDILMTVLSDPDQRTELMEICAARHNISVERIRQIYRGALADIRRSLNDDGFASMADFG